jgi:hypothetical protein
MVAKFKEFLSGIDGAKITFDFVPGFIFTLAVFMLADALTSRHLIEDMINEEGGALASLILLFIACSFISGLMVDSVFQTFIRFCAKTFWPFLKNEITARNKILENLGLYENDFDWIYVNKDEDTEGNEESSKNKLALEDATKLIRFIEIAGGTALA